MTVLVTGGSASGKSAIAERVAVQLGENRVYIATMRPFGLDATERIKRHRHMRAGKGFDTIERYDSLEALILPANTGCVLLECLSNLVANEMFERHILAEKLVEYMITGIQNLRKQADHLVIVTNEIFSDEKLYDREMRAYLRALAACNAALAQSADAVVEAVCGLPVRLKGELPL